MGKRPGNRCAGVGRLALAALLLAAAPACLAQTCLVANPSFEVGAGLDGWTPLNDVSLDASLVAHGRRAVSIGTPGGENWAISAVWQRRDAEPGTVFRGSIRVGHTEDDPLTGAARGIVNIEWRDASENLISYESFEVLGPSDPTGRLLRREFTTPPAPAGAASARLLLGTLQSPAAESGRTVFDLAELTRPDYDALQWGDFPGGRAFDFAGHSWRVKGPGFYGPGPNVFSDEESNVAVTADGMRLAITGAPGAWASSEVVLEQPLGYGDYVFTTKGRVDTIADNVVLGLFLWQYPRCYDPQNLWNQHNEIDVELSRWGDPNNDIAQFVVQPYDHPGNIHRFDIAYADDELVSYAFRWLPGRIEYRAWRGGPDDESPASMLRSWTYRGVHLPIPEQPRLHLNLWHLGAGPSDGQPQAVTLADFRFQAMGDIDGDGSRSFLDVIRFLEHIDSGDAGADLNDDGSLDTSDVILLLTEG